MSSSAVQSILQDQVYLGVWTNWSHGPVAGLTLTLTHRSGGFLTAFLALFTALAGDCLWRILSFIIHIYLSRQEPQDAPYHQRQAILRNSTTGSSAFYKLLRLLWAWRKANNINGIRRIFPLVFLSGSITLGFAVAGIFSSRLATANNGEVLLSGSGCGLRGDQIGTSVADFGLLQSYNDQIMILSSNYARSCYTDNISQILDQSCSMLPKVSLPYKVTRSMSCPFPGQSEICREPSSAIQFDAIVNSHFDLGINSPTKNRFDFRLRVQCAPLKNDGFTVATTSNNSIHRPVINYNFGTPSGLQDATFQYPATNEISVVPESNYTNQYYMVTSVSSFIGLDGEVDADISTFVPIPELQAHSDVTVYFLSSNDILYGGVVTDPWYSATTYIGNVTIWERVGSIPAYGEDEPIRVLGCTQSYQFCNPNLSSNSSCTPMNGLFPAIYLGSQIWQTVEQAQMFNWTAMAIWNMTNDIGDIVFTLDALSLVSRNTLTSGFQVPLPENQWELETENWFKIMLADLQTGLLDQATGPSNPAIKPFLHPPSNNAERKVCSSQKIRSDAFTSFNVLGMIIIFVVGGGIMIIMALLSTINKRFISHRALHRSLEWWANDTLQLQRLAHEALGMGTWKGACNDYPKTKPGEVLATLDITNPVHPRLRVCSKEGKEQNVEKIEKVLTGSVNNSSNFVETPV